MGYKRAKKQPPLAESTDDTGLYRMEDVEDVEHTQETEDSDSDSDIDDGGYESFTEQDYKTNCKLLETFRSEDDE